MSTTTGIDGFLNDESGALTIEFTTLVPFFVFLLVLFADASILYLTHSEMYNVARDAARRMSTEELRSGQDVVAYASQRLNLGDREYTVSAKFGGDMGVVISVPLGEAAISGYFFSPVIGRHLVASASVRREPLK